MALAAAALSPGFAPLAVSLAAVRLLTGSLVLRAIAGFLADAFGWGAVFAIAAVANLLLELDATHTIDPSEDGAAAKVREWTGGGVDLAVELAGAVPALQFALDITRRGGTTVTAGLPNPAARLSLSPVLLTAEERTLKGSYVGSCVPVRDIPRFADMMMQGRLPIEKLMTHRIGLDDINEGFERLAAGEAIRQVIVFD
ncbi:zinc-binding dehydrogenase [Martelella endophytica]|uniref:zinc-binding dehydrogenase n=1 Tax=Martelella endophytica TaxID=1486262 RepID=UPI000AA07053|nr:zinc-binding dehydrogenase [Martelella endophytica]